jgi:hypothetical protein
LTLHNVISHLFPVGGCQVTSPKALQKEYDATISQCDLLRNFIISCPNQNIPPDQRAARTCALKAWN